MPTEEVKSKINFIYTITNDGKAIKKKFEGDAAPKEVILTLLTVLIDDVKHNVHPEGYKEFLDLMGTQYASKLLPDLMAAQGVDKEDAQGVDKEDAQGVDKEDAAEENDK